MEPPASGTTPPVSPSQHVLASLLSFVRLLAITLFLALCVGRLGALLWRGLWVDALASLCLAVTLWSAWRLIAEAARLLRERRPWR